VVHVLLDFYFSRHRAALRVLVVEGAGTEARTASGQHDAKALLGRLRAFAARPAVGSPWPSNLKDGEKVRLWSADSGG